LPVAGRPPGHCCAPATAGLSWSRLSDCFLRLFLALLRSGEWLSVFLSMSMHSYDLLVISTTKVIFLQCVSSFVCMQVWWWNLISFYWPFLFFVFLFPVSVSLFLFFQPPDQGPEGDTDNIGGDDFFFTTQSRITSFIIFRSRLSCGI